MSLEEANLLPCYHRGCGKKFDPNDNKDDDCQHHPGQPVFHDGYKGWGCCSKKCRDFTEFLNIKGCTRSKHTNEKPPEPEKPPVDKSKINEVIQVGMAPLSSRVPLERPPFDTPQTTLWPKKSLGELEQIEVLESNKPKNRVVQKEQTCQRNACNATYMGVASDKEVCSYHPGMPIFHDGLKYWSCCLKKTTDFSIFLEQPGCAQGKHLWFAMVTGRKMKCNIDWHQTDKYMVVSIYAEKYAPCQSVVRLNPIRLSVDLYHVTENARYKLDLELKGIVDVDQSSVHMMPTKVEIKLRKAELGTWTSLNIGGREEINI